MSFVYKSLQKIINEYNISLPGDPYLLLEEMQVVFKESFNYASDGLKGYCFSAHGTDFVVVNGHLLPPEKKIIACHEAAHLILHRDILSASPMGDFSLYDSISRTEYEANLFTADFLISDEEITQLANDENNDYYKMCKILCVNPALVNFKLSSMQSRGYTLNLPLPPNSTFLNQKGFV